jgi:hypothetical protein
MESEGTLPWSQEPTINLHGRTPWTGIISPSQGRYLHTWFEPTIPVFEWAKTVHALDGAATVTGNQRFGNLKSYKDFGYMSYSAKYSMNAFQ